MDEERLENLANLLNTTSEALKLKFSENQLSKLPKTFSKHIPALCKQKFHSTSVDKISGLAKLETTNGRVFFGPQSQNNHRVQFEFVKDICPPEVMAETFLLALDITQRYLTDFTWFPKSVLPTRGGTVIELGAYLGHKTIRFVDECVGLSGKVLAVEMMPYNIDILKTNVLANDLDAQIEIMECGVWNEPTVLSVRGKGRQRTTLVEMEKLDNDMGVDATCKTLDQIIEDWKVDVVDFLMVTVNGAEIEALEGLNECASRVKSVFVATPYSRDGVRNSDPCRGLLEERGFSIIEEYTTKNRIYAKQPEH